MALSNKPWGQISESDYADAADFCRAALVDLNPSGADKAKANCHLPVREPNGGPLNRGGLFAAAAVLAGARGGVKISPDAKRQAARKLVGYYRDNELEPPASLTKLAQG